MGNKILSNLLLISFIFIFSNTFLFEEVFANNNQLKFNTNTGHQEDEAYKNQQAEIEKKRTLCDKSDGLWDDENGECKCDTPENLKNGTTLSQNGKCVTARIPAMPIDTFNQLKYACDQDKTFAEEKCDYLKDDKMTNVMSVANMLGIGMGSQTSTNTALACTKFAELAVLANVALAGFNSTCKYHKTSCEESCGQLKDFLENSCTTHACRAAYGVGDPELAIAKEGYKLCKSKDKILQAAMANMGVIMATAQNAKDCKKDSSDSNLTNTPVNCSDPAQAAKSAVCLCQKNPRDPACLAAMKAGGGLDPYASLNGGLGGAGAAGGFGNSNTLRDFTGTEQNKLGGDFSMLGGGPGDYPIDPSQMGQNSAAGVNSAGGTGGRGIPGSGNPGQGGPGDEGGGSGSKYNSDIMSTARGGRGGGPGSGSSSGSSGGDRERAYGGLPGQPNAVNLKAFLPGNKYDPRRQVANSGGPDGITGPHTNIWTKINNRYNAQRMSLMP